MRDSAWPKEKIEGVTACSGLQGIVVLVIMDPVGKLLFSSLMCWSSELSHLLAYRSHALPQDWLQEIFISFWETVG